MHASFAELIWRVFFECSHKLVKAPSSRQGKKPQIAQTGSGPKHALFSLFIFGFLAVILSPLFASHQLEWSCVNWNFSAFIHANQYSPSLALIYSNAAMEQFLAEHYRHNLDLSKRNLWFQSAVILVRRVSQCCIKTPSHFALYYRALRCLTLLELCQVMKLALCMWGLLEGKWHISLAYNMPVAHKEVVL